MVSKDILQLYTISLYNVSGTGSVGINSL
jgi:hypothetical protein